MRLSIIIEFIHDSLRVNLIPQPYNCSNSLACEKSSGGAWTHSIPHTISQLFNGIHISISHADLLLPPFSPFFPQIPPITLPYNNLKSTTMQNLYIYALLYGKEKKIQKSTNRSVGLHNDYPTPDRLQNPDMKCSLEKCFNLIQNSNKIV